MIWKMSPVENKIARAEKSMAIIADGNTHVAIADGQAVFVKNHSTLAPGLYWAKAAIAANGALSTSNLDADTVGGLNKLQNNYSSLSNKVGNVGNTDLQTQVNTLSSKYGNFGTTSNPVTNLNDLPMFGCGFVVLADSISPTESVASFSFTKQGAEGSNRYTVTVTRITSSGGGDTYVGYVYNGTFQGWQQLALKSDVDNVLVYTEMTPLVQDSIDESGDDGQYSPGDIRIPGGYKKYMLKIGVQGETYATGVYDDYVIRLLTSGQTIRISAYFNENNYGTAEISHNAIRIWAKVKTIPFDYNLYGIN